MLYEIKVLKAPWPKGAKVGDVIDMPYLPVWAEGKCSVARDGAEADFTLDRNDVLEGDDSGVGLPSAEATNAEIADLKAKLAAAEAERDDAVTGKAGADAEAKAAREKLAAAEAALAAAKPKGNGK